MKQVGLVDRSCDPPSAFRSAALGWPILLCYFNLALGGRKVEDRGSERERSHHIGGVLIRSINSLRFHGFRSDAGYRFEPAPRH